MEHQSNDILLKIFITVDDLVQHYTKEGNEYFLAAHASTAKRKSRMCTSEIITITVYFQLSGMKTFKDYYEKCVLKEMTSEFPNALSYEQFQAKKQQLTSVMFIISKSFGEEYLNGKYLMDSFHIKACHIRREHNHKTLKDIARKGCGTMGYHYGMKLHVITNFNGEIVNFFITSGNVADNNEHVIKNLTHDISGKIYCDRGYHINQSLKDECAKKNIKIIAKKKKNMKNQYYDSPEDSFYLSRRGIIESVGNILKNKLSLEYGYFRSINGFFVNIFSSIIAYHFNPEKPSIRLNHIPA